MINHITGVTSVSPETTTQKKMREKGLYPNFGPLPIYLVQMET